MSLKHRYAGKRSPEEGKGGRSGRHAKGGAARAGAGDNPQKCTCWLIMRGEGNQTKDRHTADCELVPDPSCPVHSKKYFPILD